MPAVHDLFNRKCQGQSDRHQHTHVQGKDAVHSQRYTPLIGVLLHVAILRHFKGVWGKQTSNAVVTPSGSGGPYATVSYDEASSIATRLYSRVSSL